MLWRYGGAIYSLYGTVIQGGWSKDKLAYQVKDPLPKMTSSCDNGNGGFYTLDSEADSESGTIWLTVAERHTVQDVIQPYCARCDTFSDGKGSRAYAWVELHRLP